MALLDRNFNLSQRMVQQLGQSIICGEYHREGLLPTEAELCKKFGVSRSAVREAVKMLAAKGLVSSRPRQGISILPEEQWNIFDPDLLHWSLANKPSLLILKEFLQVRIAIEPEAAALAAQAATQERIDAIARALERIKNPDKTEQEKFSAHSDFHIEILYASNNRFYIRLRDFIKTALRISTHFNANHENAFADHTNIVNAIKNRNPERAKQAMVLLIDEALDFIEAEIKSHPVNTL